MEFKAGKLETASGIWVGNISKRGDGYIFIPGMPGRKSSRKAHPTPAACVPAWAKKLLRRECSPNS